MTVLQWNREPVDGEFAKALRRGIRMHRRERGRGGHGFGYSDLRALWVSGKEHAVLTHDCDRIWQYWWQHPQRGWFLQSWHRLLAEAKQEADRPRPLDAAPSPLSSGTYVCAEWVDPYSGKTPMMIRCHTEYTAREISDVFERLGCVTSMKSIT
jgi:hypothetical protein